MMIVIITYAASAVGCMFGLILLTLANHPVSAQALMLVGMLYLNGKLQEAIWDAKDD